MRRLTSCVLPGLFALHPLECLLKINEKRDGKKENLPFSYMTNFGPDLIFLPCVTRRAVLTRSPCLPSSVESVVDVPRRNRLSAHGFSMTLCTTSGRSLPDFVQILCTVAHHFSSHRFRAVLEQAVPRGS